LAATGQPRKRFVSAITAIVICLLLFCLLAAGWAVQQSVHHGGNQDQASSAAPGRINIIMLISDGMGPASVTLARAAKGSALNLDKYLVGGLDTRASDALVTDSAAAATALASGIKTYNGAIGVYPNRKAAGTILEAAYDRGMKSGLVVTKSVTDATPAAYGSHASSRSNENFIARQLLNQTGYPKIIDVILGGGLNFFNRRSDGINLLNVATTMGYQVGTTWADIEGSTNPKLLGLFASSSLPYEIDRLNTNNTIPSLALMAKKAIQTLDRNNSNGFFLMIEGSQIDTAGHSNDAGAQIHETLAFDEAFALAIEYAKHDGRTIVISTSDHETGGLTLGFQPASSSSAAYAYYPDRLLLQTASASVMAAEIKAGASVQSVITKYAKQTLTSAELTTINNSVSQSASVLTSTIARVLGNKALIGWTTTGHTAVDVNLYAYIPPALELPTLTGNMANTEIGNYLANVLGADLAAITAKLANFDTTQVN